MTTEPTGAPKRSSRRLRGKRKEYYRNLFAQCGVSFSAANLVATREMMLKFRGNVSP